MLSRAYNVIHRFQPFVDRVFSFEPVFQEAQAIILPERFVIEIADLIMHHRGVVITGRLLARRQVKGFAHARFNKAFVNSDVALLAGVDAHIPGRVGMVEVKQAVCFYRNISDCGFFGITTIQARRQDDGKEYAYVGEVTDGWNFP